MSNNAAVTIDGGEIGRAQALQARACGLEPHTDMNPVLLKPESETGSQVVVQGKRIATVKARDYAALKPSLMAPVLDSFRRLGNREPLQLALALLGPIRVLHHLLEGEDFDAGRLNLAAIQALAIFEFANGLLAHHAAEPGFLVRLARSSFSRG